MLLTQAGKWIRCHCDIKLIIWRLCTPKDHKNNVLVDYNIKRV